MSRSSAGLAVRLAFAYAALFGWIGVYLPYWPVWLAARGMSAPQIGILLAMAPWTRVVASPFAGRWADRSGQATRLMRHLAIALVLVLSCVSLADGFVGLLLAMIAVGLVIAPIIPLTDGLAVTAEAEGRLRYGPVRSWGSIAFIFVSWAGGILLEREGESIILWMLVSLAAAIAVASMLLPSPKTTRTRSSAEPQASSPWTRTFVGLLVATALLNGSHAVLYGFGTQHWLAHGLGESTVGLLWAEGVLAEIVLFALAPRIHQWLTPRGLCLIAGAAGLVRWTVLASTVSLPWLVLGQALHAATFGAMHLGAMAYIRQRVVDGARSRASTSYSAIASGLSLGLALPLAGLMYDRFAADAYWVMTGLTCAGLLVTLGLRDLGSTGAPTGDRAEASAA